jgi:hypothetical protein
MSLAEYKESIKKIVDATNDEALLKGWKILLEHDLKQENEVEFTDEEWLQIQKGLEDYRRNETISFEEFINKRK